MESRASSSPHPFQVGRSRLTALGLVTIWGSLALLAVGILRYDGTLIWLACLGGALVGVARWWAPRNLSGLMVSRKRPEKVFASELFESDYEISRKPASESALLRTGGHRVEIRDLSIRPESGSVYSVEGLVDGDLARGSLRVRCFRRGWERRVEGEIRSQFPMGLFEVNARGQFNDVGVDEGEGMLVMPQPWLPAELRRDLEHARFEASAPIGSETEPTLEFRGVRHYRSGDAVKAVHWPATARAGHLMVREWDPPVPKPQRFGLILHTVERGRRILRPDRWELALRLATGVTAYCRANGIALTFLDATRMESPRQFRVPESGGFDSLFRHLAEVERRSMESGDELSEMAGRLAKHCDRIYVVSDVPVSRWEGLVAGPKLSIPLICIDSERVVPASRRRPRLREVSSEPLNSELSLNQR